MLEAIKKSILEAISTDQVQSLIKLIGSKERGSAELLKALKLVNAPTFRKNCLTPAIEGHWIERPQPDSPRSPTQRYRLAPNGLNWLTLQRSILR